MFFSLALMLVIVFLDQLTKYLTVLYLKPMDTFPIVEDVLHLTYAENTGAAFSMFDEPDQRWIFMSISTVALTVLLAYMYLPRPRRWQNDPSRSFLQKPQGVLERVALAMILGGGIGNMIDRFALGYVVDMIDFRLIDFAVFNVADSFVCVGAGLLALAMIRSIIREAREEKWLAEAAMVVEDGVAGGLTDMGTETATFDTETEAPDAEDTTPETETPDTEDVTPDREDGDHA